MAIDDGPEPADAGIQPVFQEPVFLSINFRFFEFEGAWVFFILVFTLIEVSFESDKLHGHLKYHPHLRSVRNAR